MIDLKPVLVFSYEEFHGKRMKTKQEIGHE